MEINKTIVQLIILVAVGIDFWLEIHAKAVPVTIGIIVGYFLQHAFGQAGTSPQMPVQAPKTAGRAYMPILLVLCALCLAASGCVTIKSGCGHMNGAEVTIPYVGGKANGNAIGCYMGCLGISCKPADYTVLQKLTSDYITNQVSDGKMAVSGPGTVTYTPAVK